VQTQGAKEMKLHRDWTQPQKDSNKYRGFSKREWQIYKHEWKQNSDPERKWMVRTDIGVVSTFEHTRLVILVLGHKMTLRSMHWISKMKDPVIPTKVQGKRVGQEWNTFKQHEE
jgi:hypothetical protein